MRLWKRKVMAVAVILLSILLVGGMLTAVAQSETAGPISEATDSPWLTMEASLGYDGVITYLRKLPLRVKIQNQGADFSGTLAMNVQRYDKTYDRYEMPVSVAAGATVQLEMPVQLNYRQRSYQAELLAADGEGIELVTITPARVLDPATLLVGTLGDQTLTHLHITAGKDPLKRGELWQSVPLTAETFPRDQKTMEAFAFLAVDGFDAHTLDRDQQQALDTWLKAGGIVILGGGAEASAGYPYFEKWTGIAAGSPYQGEDETPALLSYLKSAEKPFGEEMMLVSMTGAKHAVVRGSVPLVDVSPVGSGYVMTAAFSLSDKPLITWQGNMVLWQRLMLASMGTYYQQVVDRQVNYYGREDAYTQYETLDRTAVSNDNSFIAPTLLLFVFLALVGFGSYLLLKKRDKREWMWLSIPVLSIGFSLLFLLLSGWYTLRQPILVVSDFIQQNEEGQVTESASISMAMGEMLPITLGVGGGEVVIPDNANYFYDTDAANSGEPDSLRYLYTLGDNPGMTFPAKDAWNVNTVLVKGENPPQLNVDARCWFEEDGLHIRLKNNGEYALGEGKIITTYGYISVAALLPGQSADYLLQKAEENADAKAGRTNGNGNIPVYDGMMLTKLQQKNNDTYALISALTYPEMWTKSEKAVQLTDKDYQERSWLRSIYDAIYYRMGGAYGDLFHYVLIDDSICRMTFTLNGQPVNRTGQTNILDIKLKFELISESGYVKSGRGTIPVYVGEKGTDGSYFRGAQPRDQYQYFRLADKPVFCFVLPKEMRQIDLEGLDIGAYYIYSTYRLAAYNNQTQAWDDLDIKKALKNQLDFQAHLNGEGELYIQFSPGSTTDTYADTSTPYLTMEGRIR